MVFVAGRSHAFRTHVPPGRHASFSEPARRRGRGSALRLAERWSAKAKRCENVPVGAFFTEGFASHLARRVTRVPPVRHASFREPARRRGKRISRRGVAARSKSPFLRPSPRGSHASRCVSGCAVRRVASTDVHRFSEEPVSLAARSRQRRSTSLARAWKRHGWRGCSAARSDCCTVTHRDASRRRAGYGRQRHRALCTLR